MTLSRCLASLSCLFASAALAQSSSAPAESEETILVEGQRPGEKKPSVITQLRAMIAEGKTEQLARFEAKLCPMVIGMPRDMTAILGRLIRDNIVAVGGEVAEPGCTANSAVIFIDQPHELVHALYQQEPRFFSNFTPRQFRLFTERPRSAYSWHVSEIRSRDGMTLGNVAAIKNGSTAASRLPVSSEAQIVRQGSATRLYTNIREELDRAVVVIDRSRTEGKTLRQLADFATMHLLLDIKQNKDRFDRSSILSLFNDHGGDAVPVRMSRFDRSALTGFYTQVENNRTAAAQRQNIASAIRKEAEKEPQRD